MKAHKYIATTIRSFAIITLCAVSLACQNQLLSAPTETTSTIDTETVANERASQIELALRASVTLDDRTVNCAAPAVASYKLYGALEGESSTLLGSWFNLEDALLHLSIGIWDFTLEAYDGESQLVLEATIADIDISEPAILNFVLRPITNGSGTVDVQVSWPADSLISSVVTIFDGNTITPALEISENSVRYSNTSAAAGNRTLIFKLLDSSGNLIAPVIERVRIRQNLLSAKTITLTANDLASIPNAPSGFTAVAVGNTTTTENVSISLSWTDASNNESNFELEISDDAGSSWSSLATPNAGGIGYTDTLTRGVTRQYRLRAVNNVGTSSWVSTEVSAPWLVSFDLQGGLSAEGESTIDPIEVLDNSTPNLANTDPVRTDFYFLGWYTETEGAGIKLDESTIVTGNLTVYADWIISHTITFIANDGTANTTIQDLGEGITAPLAANSFSYGANVFLGWATSTDGEVEYADKAAYPMGSADVSLYARWLIVTDPSLFTYTVSSGKATLTSYTGSDTDVVIPYTYGRYPITFIGASCFNGKTTITSVQIPPTVISLGSYAFSGCSGLTSITLPDGLTSISGSAFRNCSSLTSISIPDSVTSIGTYAFYGCSSLSSITLPDSLTSIGYYTFFGCSSLTSITLPDDLTAIGNYAFKDCLELTSINIPEGVTSIGNSAFERCFKLSSISIPDGVTSISDSVFSSCSSLSSITLPDRVTSIGVCAFYACTSLTSITLPDSVTSIGIRAFCYCRNLTSINIPIGVTSIASSTFNECLSLTSITLPDGITSIEDFAFYDCSSLTSINIPDSVTSIEGAAFYNCSSLMSVILHPSTPPTLGTASVFSINASGRKFYVPASEDDSIITAYKTASSWSGYASAILEQE